MLVASKQLLWPLVALHVRYWPAEDLLARIAALLPRTGSRSGTNLAAGQHACMFLITQVNR